MISRCGCDCVIISGDNDIAAAVVIFAAIIKIEDF
jgi:hypothetical protein